jgi:mRNA interferase MazF
MASESIYQFGEVVLVPFPFTNQVESKKRPAVIISSPAYNTNRPDLLIMAITSQAHTAPDFATITVVDWQSAGLLKPSFAKPVLTTLEQSLVIRRMGNLSPRDQQSLHQMLTQIFGIGSLSLKDISNLASL